MAEFTHFNESGRARMVDVSAKNSTERVGTAQATVLMLPTTLEKIQRGKIAKGDVLAVAQVAGVMGAKKTPDLIPMCPSSSDHQRRYLLQGRIPAKPGRPLCHLHLRDGQNHVEGMGGVAGSAGRFQVTPEGRLLVVYYAAGTDQARKAVSENRVLEMRADGSVSQSLSLGLQRPFTSYFTATTRRGSPPSRTFDMLGQRAGSPNTISYARIRLIPDN